MKLINDWKSAWKFASVIMSGLGIVVTLTLETLTGVWAAVPADMRTHLPAPGYIAISFMVLSILGRVIQFTANKLEDMSDDAEESVKK
jgi:hypothetical protein